MFTLAKGKIILKGKFKNSGFGFSCMQKAEKLTINGRFEYLSDQEVELRIIGSRLSLEEMTNWCLKQNQVNSGKFIQLNNNRDQFSDFEIVNQL